MKDVKLATRAIHAGQAPDPVTGAVITPIYQTSTYVQEQIGVHKGYEYSRTGNPTRTALEQCLAAMESGEYGRGFASGLSAVNAVINLFNPGDHIVAGDDLYGGSYRLFTKVAARYGIKFSFVDTVDVENIRTAIRPETKMIWLETPSNPLLKLTDIKAAAAIAQAHNLLLAVDNTFASPALQRPLELGADLVLHSTTKYLGGHSDVVGGAIVTKDKALDEELGFLQNAVGAVGGPMDAWLTLRGIKTLTLRMKAHCENAMAIAEYLQGHPGVEKVYYPGLAEHPQHELAKAQMDGFGGMVSVEVKGGREGAERVASKLRFFQLAESLGGVESLVCYPAAMTHAAVPAEHRRAIGIGDGLLRFSVGIEDKDDLLKDIKQALE